MAHEEWLELAEVYALGILNEDELTNFEMHLSAGCSICKPYIKNTMDALALIPKSLEPLTPAPILKSQILDQIAAQQKNHVFTFAEEGQWKTIARGIAAKLLYMDAGRQRLTALIRMAPDSRYGNHRHTQTEEIYVLEGSCHFAGRVLRAGDYHRAEAGSIHVDMRTDEGSLMLVITAAQNEMLP